MRLSVRPLTRDPAWLGFITFTATFVIQLSHETEHVLQMLQKHVWGWRTYPGLLGQWFDFEWIHFLYNGALWLALLATWVTWRKNPGIWRASSLAVSALQFTVIFQFYHWAEHWLRMYQYHTYGWLKPPGLVGQVFSVLELHFWLGSVVTLAMITAYVGFRPWEIVRRWSAPKVAAGAEAQAG